MVQEPVDGCCSHGLGHQLIESGGMKVAAQRDRAFLVSGIDEPVEALGGVGAHREQPDVVDLDQIGAQDAADGLGDGVIGAVAT